VIRQGPCDGTRETLPQADFPVLMWRPLQGFGRGRQGSAIFKSASVRNGGGCRDSFEMRV
jgi:hypothetical protein